MTPETVLTMQNGTGYTSHTPIFKHQIIGTVRMRTLRVIQNRNIQKQETIRTESIMFCIHHTETHNLIQHSQYLYITMELITQQSIHDSNEAFKIQPYDDLFCGV
eukprot:524491_1